MSSRISTTTHPARYFFFLVLCISFMLISATGYASTTPTAQEIYAAYMQKALALPGNFQANVSITMDGEPLGRAVLGWSGGALFSYSIESPQLSSSTALQYALRPSGFSLLKFGTREELQATLVPHSVILQAIPRIFNMQLLYKLVDTPAVQVELVGETEVAGRRVYILSMTVQQEDLIKHYRSVLAEVLDDPLISYIVEDEGYSVEYVLYLFDQAMAQQPTADLQASSTKRIYIDAQDYLFLGYETTSMEAAWKEIMQQNSLLVAADAIPMPIMQPIDLESDEDGHIIRQKWHMRFTVPAALATTFSMPEPHGENLFYMDVYYTLTANNNIQLLERLEVNVAIDPALLENLPNMEDAAEDTLQPVVGEHNIIVDLKWDLSKGADPKLVENTKLLSAENAWAIGLEAFIADDQKTAIKHLSQLSRLVPTFIEPHIFLSELYHKNGQLMATIFELEQVVMLDPYNALALNNLAYYYADYELDVERALELALQAYDLVSDDAAIVDTVGWAFLKNKKLDDAVVFLEEALALTIEEDESPQEIAFSYYHLAVAYAAQERWSDACNQLKQAIELDPELEEAQQLLAEIQSKQVN